MAKANENMIEDMVRELVHGWKESARLDKKMNNADNRNRQDEVRTAMVANELRMQEVGIKLVTMVLTDLHRIGEAAERINAFQTKR